MEKEVKKTSKKTDFYLTILTEITDLGRINHIPKKHSISKQNLNYYVSYLKNSGFIQKKGYGVWVITEKGKKQVKDFSLGKKVEKPVTNLHALQINFPILQGKIYDKDWQIINKLKNWIPKYKKLDNLQGLTMRNNNNKSLTVMAKSRDISNLDEVDNLAFKIKAFVYEFFKNQGVILDVFNCKTKSMHLETEDKQAKGIIRKGEKFVLNLKKKSEKIFPKDDIDAKAWLDSSPYPFSAGTNDKEWKREYLGMPFRIKNMFEILEGTLKTLKLQTEHTQYLSENIRSHIPAWVSGAKDTREALKILKKIDNKLSQRKLKEYF